MKKGYAALNLTEKSRNSLLTRISPLYSVTVAHHCTLMFNVDQSFELPKVSKIKVIGHVFNEKIQCVVVEVEGVHKRPHGGIYHVTLSHDIKSKPVESNDLLKVKNFSPVEPFYLDVVPFLNIFK